MGLFSVSMVAASFANNSFCSRLSLFGTATFAAGILDDLPGSATVVARPRDREEALLESDLAVTVAGRTSRGSRTFLSAAAAAFPTVLLSRIFNFCGNAERGLFEANFQI